MNNLQDLPMSGATKPTDDRLNLLQETFAAALDTAHGLQKLNDQQIAQLMSGLVRAKLLNADDSYKLQDAILNRAQFDQTIDHRVEEVLRSKGVVTEASLQDLQARLGRIESRTGTA